MNPRLVELRTAQHERQRQVARCLATIVGLKLGVHLGCRNRPPESTEVCATCRHLLDQLDLRAMAIAGTQYPN